MVKRVSNDGQSVYWSVAEMKNGQSEQGGSAGARVGLSRRKGFWLNLFNAKLFPERYCGVEEAGGWGRGVEVGGVDGNRYPRRWRKREAILNTSVTVTTRMIPAL